MLPFLAAAAGAPADGITLYAQRPDWYPVFLTNSVLVGLVVLGIIFLFTRRSTSKMALVPDRPGGQNLFESIIELLYDTLAPIVGPRLIGKAFPLLASFFLFIMVANLLGLVPGVGTIGFTEHRGPGLSAEHLDAPLLRPPAADLNLTLSMALLFFVFWFWWTIQEVGAVGFLKHMFGVKGGLTGVLRYALMPLFFMVGLLEVVSIAARPVSLSLRLFGNIYAGENLMHTMAKLGETVGAPAWLAKLMSVVMPIPFFFLEILVAVLQALVFTLLCAVYIQLSTTHDEEHGDHAHADDHPVDHAPNSPVAANPALAKTAAAH